LTALDPATGSVLFNAAGTPALGDWSRVFVARRVPGATLLEAREVATGRALSSMRLPGDLAIRAVSSDGSLVALMSPLPKGATAWTPQSRSLTDIVVADPTNQSAPRRFHVKGNFEPEAFSTDGEGLFMISYVPAIKPVAYRVVRLNLGGGKVEAVYGREKTPVETMAGSRLMQVPSPDGTRLYTLYTSQPSSYAKGYDWDQAKAGGPVAFVHTLAANEGWATCVGLPKALWDGRPSDEAMAVSPDARHLYVVDTRRGIVAVMDTQDLSARLGPKVDFSSLGAGQARARISPDGSSLFVARGSGIVTLDVATLRLTQAWSLRSPVSGLGFSADGRRLYLAMPDGIELVDPSNGHAIREIPGRGPASIEYVGSLAS
jgi:hypothetical protein